MTASGRIRNEVSTGEPRVKGVGKLVGKIA
jgi:hypothetical protein